MGRPPHTGRAFGYNIDGTVREGEAELVREMFSRFVAGSGLHSLGQHAAGVREGDGSLQ
jgi:hypothetical protein